MANRDSMTLSSMSLKSLWQKSLQLQKPPSTLNVFIMPNLFITQKWERRIRSTKVYQIRPDVRHKPRNQFYGAQWDGYLTNMSSPFCLSKWPNVQHKLRSDCFCVIIVLVNKVYHMLLTFFLMHCGISVRSTHTQGIKFIKYQLHYVSYRQYWWCNNVNLIPVETALN